MVGGAIAVDGTLAAGCNVAYVGVLAVSDTAVVGSGVMVGVAATMVSLTLC